MLFVIPVFLPDIVGVLSSIEFVLSPIINVPLFSIPVPIRFSIVPVFSSLVSIIVNVPLFVNVACSLVELPTVCPFNSIVIFCPSFIVVTSSVSFNISTTDAVVLAESTASCIV